MRLALPSRLPDGGNTAPHSYHMASLNYLCVLGQYLVEAGGTVETHDDVGSSVRHFMMRVDGVLVCVDISDYPVDRPSPGKVVFRFTCLPEYEHFNNIASLSLPWATDRATCDRILSPPVPVRQPERVGYRGWFQDDDIRPGRYVRRKRMLQVLEAAFGNRLDHKLLPSMEYLDALDNGLVHVHTGGAAAGHIDRSTLQIMARGRCLIQPVLAGYIGGEIPEPFYHYVPCRHDLTDLVSRVRWCQDNQDKALEIGRNARELFMRNCAPLAVWQRVQSVVQTFCEHGGYPVEM